ncbi:hypothetical protein [Cryobacterium fucosi]|nr:hypothetical protein [Cryobacterium fucosi]
MIIAISLSIVGALVLCLVVAETILIRERRRGNRVGPNLKPFNTKDR